MIDYARHYERSFSVDAETLQLDLIRKVGIAGSYLDTDHTLFKHQDYLYNPLILNRKAREDRSCPQPDVARRRAEEILAADTEEKIGAAEADALRRIERSYREA